MYSVHLRYVYSISYLVECMYDPINGSNMNENKSRRDSTDSTVRGCLLHRRRTTSVTRVLIAVRSAPDGGEDESVEQNAEHD